MAGDVSLKLYNLAGQLVCTIATGRMEIGHHVVHLDVASLPQGTYFLVLETGDMRVTRSVVILR